MAFFRFFEHEWRSHNQYIQVRCSATDGMSLECERECPVCDERRVFYRAASTTLRLGEKVKWRCPECGYAFVTIGEAITSNSPA